jgi:hypothetical protein
MALHLLVPGIVARIAFPIRWQRAWVIMVGTMIVDMDHLLATPVFDPNRCSIGLHPLHTWPFIAIYLLMTAFPKTRLVGLGLVIHMALDGLDCLSMAWPGDA